MPQMTSGLDTPLGLAQSNFAGVQGRLLTEEVALERLYDGQPSDQEIEQHEAEIATQTARLAQRLAELNALEAEMDLPLTPIDQGIDDPEPRRVRLRQLRDQRERSLGRAPHGRMVTAAQTRGSR